MQLSTIIHHRNSFKMSQGFRLLITLISIHLTIAGWQNVVNCIVLFDDNILPPSQLQGPHFEYLGRVTLLPGFKPVKQVETMNTKFKMSTRDSRPKVIEFEPISFTYLLSLRKIKLPFDVDQLASVDFNPKRKSVIMIAGYLSNEAPKWLEQAERLWLQLEDVNVITVTWSGSNKYMYSSAVSHVPLIARQISVFLYYLAKSRQLDFQSEEFAKRIHFIGHSLGAHIGALVGRDLGGRLGRITGLDPAGPAFDGFPRELRLDPSDALFVDVIHSNAGVMKKLNVLAASLVKAADMISSRLPLINRLGQLIKKEYTGEGDTAWFGIDQQVGHVDYYANNGKTQPGCTGVYHTCDHGRAHDLFLGALAYDVALVNGLNYTMEQRKVSRLLAFAADSYENFLSGANLIDQCASLMQRGEQLGGKAAGDLQAHCSIPIDFITPVDELIEEFRSKYNVALNHSSQGSNRRYYFQTLDKETYLGDHYLLKLHLDGDQLWDPTQCSLNAKLDFANNLSIQLNLEHMKRSPNDSFPETIAIPFIHPQSIHARGMVNFLLSTNETLVQRAALEQNANLILPEQVTISIENPKAKGVFQTIRNNLFKAFQRASTKRCDLSIGMIEVHPVVIWPKNFAGVYGLKSSHQAIDIKTMEEQANIRWTESRISRLSPRSIQSTSRSLVALVVSN